MIEAFLRSNPLQIIREGTKAPAAFSTGIPLKLTQESAEKLIEKAPGVETPMARFPIFLSQVAQRAIPKAI